MSNRLQWEVFVSGQIPVVTDDLAPGATEMVAYFFYAYFGRTGCGARRHRHYGRAKPENR